MVDMKLFRGIDGHKLERFLFRHGAVFHRLGRLGVHAAGEFGVVGVEAYEEPLVAHERAVVGYGVVDLGLVCPPVAEGRGHGAVGAHRLGHLVAFENVDEHLHLEMQFLRQPDEREDLVLTVGVALDLALPVEDLGERLQPEVAARRDEVLVFLHPGLVLAPLPFIVGGGAEGITQ